MCITKLRFFYIRRYFLDILKDKYTIAWFRGTSFILYTSVICYILHEQRTNALVYFWINK